MQAKTIVRQGKHYDARLEEIRQLRMGGAMVEEISEKTGLDETQIKKYLREAGLPESGSCFFSPHEDFIEAWYKNGCIDELNLQRCAWCGKSIVSGRKFCCEKCKNAYWNDKKRKEGKNV